MSGASQTENLFHSILVFSSENLVPIMLGIFAIAMILKIGSYLTVKMLNSFINHFEVNTMETVTHEERSAKGNDFYDLVKNVFWKSFEEHFIFKSRFKRRKLDRLSSFTDRALLIKEGSRRLIDDTLHHAKYCTDYKTKPDLGEIVTYLVKSNPVFKKVYGVFPVETISELMLVLPNIFVVLGIFGTFIGIMLALPELNGMDLSNVELTKKTMDQFLMKIAFSMNTSILGIILSISLNLLNSFFSGDIILDNIKDTFKNSLGLLWNESHSGKKVKAKESKEQKVKAS